MNILLASDDRFVQHCCVTITSVLINNPGAVFYLFTEGLTNENTQLLKEQVKRYKGELIICIVGHDQVKDFPMPSFMSSHISIATYYRLFAARILPEKVKKVIYLDCDIVVRGSLMGLWRKDVDDYALAAVYQSHEHSEGGEVGPKSYTRLNIPPDYGYFNAGVLLVNLEYWRNKNVTDRLFDFIKNHCNLIHAHDQDVLNAVLYAETKVLDPTWNFREHFMNGKQYTYPSKVNYSELPENPIVVHFVSKPKPWEYFCNHPYRKEYYKYLDLTPYKGWKPKFSWKQFKRDRLFPWIVKNDRWGIRYLFIKRKKI